MIRSVAGGVVLTVRVVPRASKSGIAGTRGSHNDALLVRLNAPPVDGAANAELVDVLARALDVPKRAVTLVAGERSRTKRVHVEGIDELTARARLGELGPGPSS